MNGRTASPGKVSCKVGRRATMVALVFPLTLLITHLMQAQTFSVLHNFAQGAGGANPEAGVTVGPSGVLYGTASYGGTHNNDGTIFKLSQVHSSWVFSPLYEFIGGFDGAVPYGGVAIGPNGALYGTAETRGVSDQGTVFELRPPLTVCKGALCYWNQAVLHAFAGYPVDGAGPQSRELSLRSCGRHLRHDGRRRHVWRRDRVPADPFSRRIHGEHPVIASAAGVTACIRIRVWSSIPPAICTGPLTLEEPEHMERYISSCLPTEVGWRMSWLTSTGRMGNNPYSNLIVDASGNLYGTTYGGGQNGGGVVYKLAPSGGGFAYSALYTFSEYCDSYGGVAMDAAGNLFGVCSAGGAHE